MKKVLPSPAQTRSASSAGIYARNRILLGDCIERMRALPSTSVDFILTDPPYLVNYQDRSGRRIENDCCDRWLKPAFAEMYRLLKPNSYAVVFYGWNAVDRFMTAWKTAGFQAVGHLVWHKSYASKTSYLHARHECAYLLVKGRPDVPASPLPDVQPWQYSGNRLHPTQKPVSILCPLIETFSRSGDLVLDPFAGSGSTAVAAYLTQRDYLGFELNRGYHAEAVQRLKNLVQSRS